MKKLSSLFALLLLIVTMAGCSKEDSVPEVVVTPEVEEEVDVEAGLETEEDTVNTGEATFESAKKELELLSQ